MSAKDRDGGDSAMPPNNEDTNGSQASGSSLRSARSIFSIPAPIKRIFDRFPLTTYPANELPHSTIRSKQSHELYIFTDTRGSRHGKPSFNPQCLKWQAYLKFTGVEFVTIPSNNHASPTGALPFLLPAASPSLPSLTPIPSNKLRTWAAEQVQVEQESQFSMRAESYASLLDHRIRNAWLCTLYLNNQNFDAIARKLYIEPSTSNSLVRIAMARQLQQAARDELLKYSDFIDVDDLEIEAKKAFSALSTLLGDEEYFFGRETPGLFDASVFAYTYLLLDESLGWKQNPLAIHLKAHDNLVQHQKRLVERFF
ncbi:hypothetical protein FQN54_009028 [Arachnomyces sp. PD_36]|nr:hypothetical protein FQN54_009028 [Arachnomyces sp. PD_36]